MNLVMDILQTFEIFLRAPLSILRSGFIQIMHIETPAVNGVSQSSLDVDFVKNKTQVTVVNNKKVYTLLKMATYKANQRMMAQQKSQKLIGVR